MSFQSWWPWVAGVIVVAVLIVAYIQDKKRTEALTAWAQSRGLTYQKWDNQWAQIDLGWPYDEGRSHRAKHVMTGEHSGRPFVLFEHHWVTGSGKERKSHQVMVCALELPRAFPKLEVGRENLFSSIARRMGLRDIEFESDEFNEAYKIHCQDRKFAYDVIHPRFMTWLLANSASGFVISGRYLAHTFGSRFQEQYVDSHIAYLDAIAEHIPAFVWDGQSR